MRRLLLIAGALLALGLSTAVAASFNVQAEDITSFSTSTSISVPEAVPFPATIYLGGTSGATMGDLLLTLPANNPVQSREIKLAGESVTAQTDVTKFYTWRTPTAPSHGYLLSGDVTLTGIDQNKGPSNRMTAALLNCPESALASSTDPGPCSLIASAIAPASTGNGNGYLARTVSFGPIPPTTIPAGNQLRLKIVNQDANPPDTLSVSDWDVQWGFLPSRQSVLQITAP